MQKQRSILNAKSIQFVNRIMNDEFLMLKTSIIELPRGQTKYKQVDLGIRVPQADVICNIIFCHAIVFLFVKAISIR